MITQSLNRSIASLVQFFLPWACAGCRAALSGSEDEGFCDSCWLKIRRITGWVCTCCGVPLSEGGSLCYACRSAPFTILIRAAVEYRGVIPPAIHRFKYAGRKTLVRSFSILMRSAWDRWPETHDAKVLVPVPLHPRSQRQRGYNQASLLARALSANTGIPVMENLLLRSRATTPQFKLSRIDRLANLDNAFDIPTDTRLAGHVKSTSILLIDDICTTGATLQQCARALRRAGARQVQALVLARD